MSKWVESLNEEQKEAALHNYGPMLILAGAGSGKTTTLVSRTGRLIDEKIVSAKNICVLTFTNKAARELKTRVEKRLPKKAKDLWTGTFHAYGVRTLRMFYKELGLPKYFGIMDQQDSISLVKDILKDFKHYNKSDFDPNILLALMSRWRERGVQKASSDSDYDIMTEWVLPKYSQKKNSLGVVDFDDLILKVIELYQENPLILEREQNYFQQVMVDEFQDTNVSQMLLVEFLAKKHQNISVVGDDDQSIYGWRGAQVQNILNFPKRFKDTKVIRLEKNYRSTPQILNLANDCISKNKTRYKKILKNPNEALPGALPELFIYDQDTDEIDGVIREIQTFKEKGFLNKDIAILYRANSQGALVEATLRQNGIPYKLSGGTSFLERREVKDVLSYLRCAFRPNDIDFRRIFNTPPRGLGDSASERIIDGAKKENSSFYKGAIQWKKNGISEKNGASINSLLSFLTQFKSKLISSPEPISEVLLKSMEEIGYDSYLRTQTKDSLVAAKRWGIVEVFARSVERGVLRFNRTEKGFLEYFTGLELKDEEEGDVKDEVQLLTLHACKGLEFPCVIIMGLEEDILPHKKLGQDISEERRLFYVGITRAEKHLVLTHSRKRFLHGKWKPRVPSRFLEEVNPSFYIKHENGFRPVTREERTRMMSQLMDKLKS